MPEVSGSAKGEEDNAGSPNENDPDVALHEVDQEET